MSWESQAFGLIASIVLRPLALAAAAWLLICLLKIRHPASCHSIWTAVLAGMLLLPVVSIVTPHWTLPILPQIAVSRTSDLAALDVPTSEPIRMTSASRVHAGASAARPGVAVRILYCYAAGLFAMVMYRLVGWVLLWRVVSGSNRLRTRLRESGSLLTPVAIGILRPTVILPAGWREWSANTRRAILAHEFAHLRRHDAAVCALARLVKCIFWFHPLAWWVSRKVSDLAELACDAAAIEKVQDPAGYARILLEFAGAVNRAGRRVTLPGLAMAGGSGMGRRIDRVFELSAGTPRKLARPGVALALVGLPLICLSATVEVKEQVRLLSARPLSSQDSRAQSPKSSPPIRSVKKIAQAQVAPAPPAAAAPPNPYRAWLNEDAAYIISDAERSAYRQLATAEELEKFIEQFWLRRDPTPGTKVNEFKEEHYRRIAYANEHFRPASGLPGWKTDRGRVYIMYGPPDELETHPSDGSYSRPLSEGGGNAITYAFEQWRYKYFQGVGSLIVEFVDPTLSGEFRMTLDPSEKYRKP
jgi:GWxTD domain-containing protein